MFDQLDTVVIRLCTIFAALCVPYSSSANIFSPEGVDPRSYVDQLGRDWRILLPVGTLESEFALRDARGLSTATPGLGTTFIVSPCYALTNYHVVFGSGRAAPSSMQDYPVMLKFGFRDNRRPIEFAKGQVRLWGSLSGSDPDIALIKMDKCLGKRLGWYDMSPSEQSPLSPIVSVMMPSFSVDRSLRQISIQRACEIRGYDGRSPWIIHDCATREGASGAPLMLVGSGIPKVIGINAGEQSPVTPIQQRFERRFANFGVAMQQLDRLPRVRIAILRDIADANVQNPLGIASEATREIRSANNL